MNTFFSRILFIFLLSMITFIVNAQPKNYWDYIITTKGDTVRCHIDKPLIGKAKYQSRTMAKPEKITTDSVREFYYQFDHVYYRAVYIDSAVQKTFLEIIEKGPITLYEVETSNGNTIKTDWYISKNTDTAKSLKSSSYLMGRARLRRDEFGEMLKDKPDIYNKYIADEKFSFKQIQKLVHWYNTGKM